TDVFANVVMPNGCQAGGCHGPGSPNFYTLSDAPSMKAAWVNQKSGEVPTMNRVTPGDVDQSYVLYKVCDEQKDAGVSGTGDQMPQGGPYLSEEQVCALANWIKAGAP